MVGVREREKGRERKEAARGRIHAEPRCAGVSAIDAQSPSQLHPTNHLLLQLGQFILLIPPACFPVLLL
ncbi:hypothetical protein CRENBAI_006221 [Crenichthys baileyi]|uniref:Uncharacterized protein n=1 Tax=Crenichthys baileyi TaxID=28760 RepID=A0AAV9RVL4_9TELE